MDIFVTGGSGFVGGRLIADLVKDGHRVSALARSDASADTSRAGREGRARRHAGSAESTRRRLAGPTVPLCRGHPWGCIPGVLRSRSGLRGAQPGSDGRTPPRGSAWTAGTAPASCAGCSTSPTPPGTAKGSPTPPPRKATRCRCDLPYATPAAFRRALTHCLRTLAHPSGPRRPWPNCNAGSPTTTSSPGSTACEIAAARMAFSPAL